MSSKEYPHLPPEQVYGGAVPAPDPEKQKRTGPNPWTSPPRPEQPTPGTVLEKPSGTVIHPFVSGTPGTVVKLADELVGYVKEDGKVWTEHRIATRMIKEGFLTKLDAHGNLIP